MRNQHSMLALIALAIAGAASGQGIRMPTYVVQFLGPASQNLQPSMGIDDTGRAAGCVNSYLGEFPYPRAWTYDPQTGYTLSEATKSTVGAVSPDGTIVGSFYGAPTTFDWAGHPTLVFPDIPGAFTSINKNKVFAGYVFELTNGMTQVAKLYSPNGTWTTLGSPSLLASAAYGINDAGQAVGSATDASGTHAVLWDGSMTYLPVSPGLDSVACGMNNMGEIVGYIVSPDRSMVPVLWQSAPSNTYTLIPLPLGYTQGIASAVNDNGTVAGSMWILDPSDAHAFIYSPSTGLIDLNEALLVHTGIVTLVSANAFNTHGQIVGVAKSLGNTFAFVASPILPKALGSGLRK